MPTKEPIKWDVVFMIMVGTIMIIFSAIIAYHSPLDY